MGSFGFLALVTVLILVTSFKRVPGVGVIAAMLIIGITIWLRDDGLFGLGFFPPKNWSTTIAWSIMFGITIQFLSTLILEPLADKITKSRTDHSSFDNLRGNLMYFLLILVGVWVVVVFLEEIIFRGYMMGDVAELIGTSKFALAVNLIFTSAVFGLAHWYQGKSGALSTGIIGRPPAVRRRRRSRGACRVGYGVIPAQAEICRNPAVAGDSRLRGNDST